MFRRAFERLQQIMEEESEHLLYGFHINPVQYLVWLRFGFLPKDWLQQYAEMAQEWKGDPFLSLLNEAKIRLPGEGGQCYLHPRTPNGDEVRSLILVTLPGDQLFLGVQIWEKNHTGSFPPNRTGTAQGRRIFTVEEETAVLSPEKLRPDRLRVARKFFGPLIPGGTRPKLLSVFSPLPTPSKISGIAYGKCDLCFQMIGVVEFSRVYHWCSYICSSCARKMHAKKQISTFQHASQRWA